MPWKKKPLQFNPQPPEAAQAEAVAKARREIGALFVRVFKATPDGQHAFGVLADHARVHRSVFDPKSEWLTAYNSGKQDLMLWVMDLMREAAAPAPAPAEPKPEK